MNFAQEILRSRWLSVRMQIALGIVFVFAAWPKLLDPPTFAKNIWAYDIVPGALINLQALIMPGVELVVGVALVLGLWRRGAAIVAALMLLVFMVALSWALIEGNPVHCSCFEINAAPKTDAELLYDLKLVLARDIGLLLMSAYVIWERSLRRFRR